MLFVNGYKEELEEFVIGNKDLFVRLHNSSFLISGAAGMIGSYIIDLLITSNRLYQTSITVLALDKNRGLLDSRFPDTLSGVTKIYSDVNQTIDVDQKVVYVIHAASNTSPLDYANMPVATMRTNLIGTDNMIQFSLRSGCKRFLFCSSVEAYGSNNGDVDFFDENYSGYVNSNSLRAGYPSAKRASEALLNAYATENPAFDFTIARIGRVYGPTIILGDTKAPTQFIMDAVHKRNIVMKSSGLQEFSFCYVADCAIAMIKVLLDGAPRNAYNIADPNSTVLLRDFAKAAAEKGGTQVIFEQMTDKEMLAYSQVTKAKMNMDKLLSLGWKSTCGYLNGIERTVNYLRDIV